MFECFNYIPFLNITEFVPFGGGRDRKHWEIYWSTEAEINGTEDWPSLGGTITVYDNTNILKDEKAYT